MRDLFHEIKRKIDRPSLEAAALATGASRPAILAVRTLLSDGQARTDEEIADQVVYPGGRSPDVIRHARLALVHAGLVKWTGGVRETSYGVASKLWVRA